MKKGILKRIIAFVAVILIICSSNVISFAETENNLIYTVNGSEVKITGYNGNNTTVTIPSSLSGRMVTEIGSAAFAGKSFIQSINIPETVKSISQEAFKDCSSLKEITIPAAVTNIAEYAFSGCVSLNKVSVLSALTAIGHYAFQGCTSLKEISIPSTKIGQGAFKNCASLETIELLSPVSSLGRYAFDGTKWYNSQPEGLLCIDSVVYSYTGDDKSVIIPDGIRTIADYAFSYTDVASVVLPDGLYYIGNNSFAECNNLTYLSIPKSVISIGLKAFGYKGNTANNKFTVYCYKDSAASVWADGNNLKKNYIDNCIHVYSDWEVTTKPDCIAGGLESRRCIMCNDLQTKRIPEQGHSWSGWVNISNLTCLTDGIKRRTCTSCGITEDDVTITKGHTWSDWVVATEPDCINYGISSHYCTACKIEETVRTDAKGHTWTVDNTTDANGWVIVSNPLCAQTGKKSRTCKICGYINIALIDALGHKTDEWEVLKDPTAITPGEKQGICLVCGETFTESIPALNESIPDGVSSLTLIDDSIYHFDSSRTCLYGVSANTTISDVLLQFEYPSNIIVTNTKLEQLSNDKKIGTGCFLVLVKYSEETKQNEPLDTICVLVKGDANGDGLLTAADARIILRASAKLDTIETPFILANDFDGNGTLSASEARKVLRVASKLDNF